MASTTQSRAPGLIRSQIGAGAILTGLSLFLPFLTHALPVAPDDPRWGGILLPLFYAPLIAALCYKPGVLLLVAVLPPWLNHFLLGMPPEPMAILLTFELMTFSLMARGLAAGLGRRSFVGPLAFLLMKPVEGLFLTVAPVLGSLQPWDFVTRTTLTATPGIVLLGLVSALAIHFLPDVHGAAKD